MQQPAAIDPSSALLTLLVTALVGLLLGVVLMFIVNSRRYSKPFKRVSAAIAFILFMIWLVTLGDPHSDYNFMNMYSKSIKSLPERFWKRSRRVSAGSTNNPATNDAGTNVAPAPASPAKTNK